MGKHEPMSAKAIANKIKAKGLQKIKYYCEMCKKQCRDDNGFKCHIASEAHQRQALVVGENPDQFVNEFSKDFTDTFMYILRTRYRTKRVLANTVFQDLIKDREHTHLNSTRWTSLTEFAQWIGENGLIEYENSERGPLVTYIDRDPETLRRQEIEARRAEQAKEEAVKNQKEIERQMEMAKKIYEQIESKRSPAKPIPIVTVLKSPEISKDGCPIDPSISDLGSGGETIDKPMFQVQSVTLKSSKPSAFKPPPPKRKVQRSSNAQKKVKSG